MLTIFNNLSQEFLALAAFFVMGHLTFVMRNSLKSVYLAKNTTGDRSEEELSNGNILVYAR